MLRENIFCCSLCLLLLGTGHPRKNLALPSLHPPLQVFVHTEKILLSFLFSRPNSLSSPSLSSYEESPLISLVALHWPLFSNSTSHTGQLGTGHYTPDVASPALSGGKLWKQVTVMGEQGMLFISTSVRLLTTSTITYSDKLMNYQLN